MNTTPGTWELKDGEIVCGKKTIAVIDGSQKEADANGRVMRMAPELVIAGGKLAEFIGWLLDEDRLTRDEQLIAYEAMSNWRDTLDRAM